MKANDLGLELSSHISKKAYELLGNKWYKYIHDCIASKTWTVEVSGELLKFWPDTPETWKKVDRFGKNVSEAYWLRKHVGVFRASPEINHLEIDRLISVKRAGEILDRVAHHGKNISTPDLLRIFDATFDTLKTTKSKDEPTINFPSGYDVSEFLKLVRGRRDSSKEEIARREYLVLPLLRYQQENDLTLHQFMATDPSFFVDVICQAYWPAKENTSGQRKQSEEEEGRASISYELLKGMHVIPGDESGRIDKEFLFEWIDSVLRIAKEKDREDVAKSVIGRMVAHAAEDPDDQMWPHQTIRELIEKIKSIELERELRMERFNMRGAYSKAMFEGGAQERALAQQNRQWAEASRSKWPRTAKMLGEIADSWEEDGHREDERAEQDKVRFS